MKTPAGIARTLQIAGIVALALAFMPYLRNTPTPVANTHGSNTPLPGSGAATDQSSETHFTLGLPFSPLFAYRNATKITVESPAPSTSGRDGENPPIEKSKPGAPVFSSVSSMTWSTRLEFASLSMLSFVLGIGMLAFREVFLKNGKGGRRERRPTAPETEIASGGET